MFQFTFLLICLRFHVCPLAHKQVAPMCRNPPILGRETEAAGPPEQLLVVASGIKALL